MKVSAADKGTWVALRLALSVKLTNNFSGKLESITITNEKGRLSQEDIDRMVPEAEQFATEDDAQRKRIEALN